MAQTVEQILQQTLGSYVLNLVQAQAQIQALSEVVDKQAAELRELKPPEQAKSVDPKVVKFPVGTDDGRLRNHNPVDSTD